MPPEPTRSAESVLFRAGNFKLHSGEESGFKIDCDALTGEDIETLARMLADRLPLFGRVEGVPQGGLRLAAAMERYARPAQSAVLIVDDVLTSGGSMEEQRAGRDAIGAVVFARREPPAWVTPLFMLTPTLIDGQADG